MGALFPLADLVISFMKQIRFYGISLFDVSLWTVYLAVTFYVVFYLFSALTGGGDD